MDTPEGTEPVVREAPSGDAVPGPLPQRRRSRLGLAMVAIGALLLLAAIPIAIIGFGAQSDASDERSQATAARKDQAPQEAHRLKLAQARLALNSTVNQLQIKAGFLGSGIFELGTAQGHVRDVSGHAAAAYNAGDPAGGATVWRTDGQTALDDLTQKDAAAQKLLHDTQALLQQLKEGA